MNRLVNKLKNAAIVNLVFAAAVGFFTFILSREQPRVFWGMRYGVGMAAFLFALHFSYRVRLRERLFARGALLQAAIACVLGVTVYQRYQTGCALYAKDICANMERWFSAVRIGNLGCECLAGGMRLLFAIAIFLMFFLLMSCALPAITRCYAGMSKAEKRYFAVSCAFWIVFACAAYNRTNLFYQPNAAGRLVYFDSLYNMDTCTIYTANLYAYFIPFDQNDIRQMLFGVFSTPFAAAARLLGYAVFRTAYGYALGLACMQIAAIRATVLLLGRLAVSDEEAAWRPWFWILLELSFSTILFGLCLEQTVFPVFWAVLLIYAYIKKKPGRDLLYIAATGSLITSGILFPLITDEKKTVPFGRDLAKAFLTYCGFAVTFGCTHFILVEALPNLNRWLGYDEMVPLVSRLLQYVSFSSLIFLHPASFVDGIYYSMSPVTAINPVGVIVLALAAAGFLLNRKHAFARICLAWVLLSVFVIVVVGWGTMQTATIVYSYYLGWAFVSLVFMAIMRLLNRQVRLKKALLCAVFAAMLLVNAIGMADILRFAFAVYGSI